MRLQNKEMKPYRRIRECLDLIKFNSRYTNHIRLHNSTTKAHKMKICEICIWLQENGFDFVTEAEFMDGGRADIVVLDEHVAIEVLNSESLKSFEENKSKYPIRAIAHKVDQEWKGL